MVGAGRGVHRESCWSRPAAAALHGFSAGDPTERPLSRSRWGARARKPSYALRPLDVAGSATQSPDFVLSWATPNASMR